MGLLVCLFVCFFEVGKGGREGGREFFFFLLSLASYGEICSYQNCEIIVKGGLRKIASPLPSMYSLVFLSLFFIFIFLLNP